MNLCNWREKLPSSPGDAEITIFKGVPAHAFHPAAVMASYTFMSLGPPTLPLSITIIKDKGKVRGERKTDKL